MKDSKLLFNATLRLVTHLGSENSQMESSLCSLFVPIKGRGQSSLENTFQLCCRNNFALPSVLILN